MVLGDLVGGLLNGYRHLPTHGIAPHMDPATSHKTGSGVCQATVCLRCNQWEPQCHTNHQTKQADLQKVAGRSRPRAQAPPLLTTWQRSTSGP
jgi:hypothetical protein